MSCAMCPYVITASKGDLREASAAVAFVYVAGRRGHFFQELCSTCLRAVDIADRLIEALPPQADPEPPKAKS